MPRVHHFSAQPSQPSGRPCTQEPGVKGQHRTVCHICTDTGPGEGPGVLHAPQSLWVWTEWVPLSGPTGFSLKRERHPPHRSTQSFPLSRAAHQEPPS
jgi:hypothetical protein